VRDTIYDELSRTRRAAWHGEAADTIRRIHPGDVEALAHHLDRAGRPDAADAARAAAELAERRFEPHRAVVWWRTALRHAGRAPTRTQAELIMGLARSLAVTGELGEARRRRGEAIELASGDPALTTRVICAFDIPASWAANDDPSLATRIATAAAEALHPPAAPTAGALHPPAAPSAEALRPPRPAVPPEPAAAPTVAPVLAGALAAAADASAVPEADRCRLLATIAMELRNAGGPPAREAAEAALRIARRLDDPALLAYALNAVYLQTYHRAGLAAERDRIAAELLALAERHGLITYRVLGHLVLMQTRSALGDFAEADRHADAADRLADEYRITLVAAFTAGYRAMRAGVPRGETLHDETLHDEMPGVDVRLDQPATADAMLEARLCHQARAAIARGDRAEMRRLAELLAPAAGERAAGSALIDLGPIADVLKALTNNV
jgi:hypothetical protein